MNLTGNPLARFFGVVFRGETYLNLLYLLLAFPLGIFYFIFLITGFAAGLPLLFLFGLGLVILLVVFAGWWAFAAFERQLAIWLLREDIAPMQPKNLSGADIGAQVVAYLTNPVTWTSLVYLFLKFPLGLVSFVVVVTLGALSLSLLTAPLTFQYLPLQVWYTWEQSWQLDTLGEALAACAAGAILAFLSLHAFNGLAWLSGRFARLMLGSQAGVAAPPAVSAAPPGGEESLLQVGGQGV